VCVGGVDVADVDVVGGADVVVAAAVAVGVVEAIGDVGTVCDIQAKAAAGVQDAVYCLSSLS